MRQVSQANDLAKTGELVCSSEAWSMIETAFVGKPCGSTTCVQIMSKQPNRSSEDEARENAWIEEELFTRYAHGSMAAECRV